MSEFPLYSYLHEEPKHLDLNLVCALRNSDNLLYKFLIPVLKFYIPEVLRWQQEGAPTKRNAA